MTPTWLEAAINGPWSRSRQPLIPIAVSDCIADGIACAREGAAIIHVHAYDAATGFQNDDAETYARIIEGIRANGRRHRLPHPAIDGDPGGVRAGHPPKLSCWSYDVRGSRTTSATGTPALI
jgi:3-keto-5-aminohexanoate cleavage enzyme